MRIAYSLGSLNRGGTETLLLDVVQNIDVRTFILIYRKPGELENDFLKKNICAFLLNHKIVLKQILHLSKLLTNNSIDIVHAHQPLDAFYAIIANIGTNRKTILTIHGFDYQDSFFYKLLLFFVLHFTNKNLFVSNTQKKYYQNKFRLDPIKQVVVYNGINFSKIQLKHNKLTVNQLKLELNLQSNTILLGTVGNFVYGRNQLFLCRFVKVLFENKVNFHFVFIGKQSSKYPQLYDNCLKFCEENGLSNNVSFMGSREDVPSLLSDLDGFFYASDHDTFGIAVVEAIAAGIPVFVNDIDTMLEITNQGNLANIYKSNDVNDLFAIFEKYLSEIDDFNQKAFKNAELVRKKYSIQNHIANLNQVYNSL